MVYVGILGLRQINEEKTRRRQNVGRRLFLSYSLFMSCLCYILGRAVSPVEPWFLHQPVNVLLRVTTPMTADLSASQMQKSPIPGSHQPQELTNPGKSPTLIPLNKDDQSLPGISYFAASFTWLCNAAHEAGWRPWPLLRGLPFSQGSIPQTSWCHHDVQPIHWNFSLAWEGSALGPTHLPFHPFTNSCNHYSSLSDSAKHCTGY